QQRLSRAGATRDRRIVWRARGLRAPVWGLFSQPHADVARGAHIGADVTADTARVIGIHIPSRRRLLARRLLDRLLRAIDDAIVALEAQPAAHAAARFGPNLFLGERQQAFLEVVEHLFGADFDLPALVARGIREVAEEELVRGDDLIR